MELQVQKEKINIKRRIAEKCKKIVIEKDVILPDNKPDIIKVLSDNSNIYMSKKENMENKCKIEGGIETRIAYLTGEGKSRILKVEEMFSETLDVPGMSENCFTTEKTCVNLSQITILNERKIHYKAEIECCICVTCMEEVEFICGIEDEKNLQTLKQKKNINEFITHGETKIGIKENIDIENVQENIETVKFDYEIRNLEQKVSYNKVLIKADCDLKAICQTESGVVQCVQKQVPIMGFLDMENVDENDMINIEFTTRNIIISENDIKPAISIELELNIIGDVYRSKEIILLTDLYDLNYKTEFSMQNTMLDCGNTKALQTNSVEQKCIIDDINQLCDSKLHVINVEKNENVLNVEIRAIYMYTTFENQGINSKEETFKIQIKLENNIEDMTVSISNVRSSVLPDSSVQTSLNIDIFNNSLEEINLINEISLNEEDKDDGFSMIIYFVKPGDTLWNIAKRFKSTIDDIVKVNDIENENMINEGDKLYIPRAI